MLFCVSIHDHVTYGIRKIGIRDAFINSYIKVLLLAIVISKSLLICQSSRTKTKVLRTRATYQQSAREVPIKSRMDKNVAVCPNILNHEISENEQKCANM